MEMKTLMYVRLVGMLLVERDITMILRSSFIATFAAGIRGNHAGIIAPRISRVGYGLVGASPREPQTAMQ
jgi:hypothetical protein